MRQDTGRRFRHTRCLSLICATVCLTVACVPQSIRSTFSRSADSAASDTVLLEPGIPPVEPLEWTLPLRIAKKSQRTSPAEEESFNVEDEQPTLRMDGAISVYPDVWARTRAGLELAHLQQRRIDREIDWYRRNQDYLDRVASRANLYLPFIVRELEKRGMPLDLALLPIVESAFQPFARSPANASGLWQFIPSTGRRYGLKQNWWYDGRRDVVEATRAALDYLQKLHGDFDGDWLLAVAAYNSGEGNVGKAVRRNKRSGKSTDFWSLRLHRETRTYVPRLIAISAIVANPGRYGITLKHIEDQVIFEQIVLDTQIDLAVAASLSGQTLEELYLLNPGYNRWATDPAGPHRLLLPKSALPAFVAGLAATPKDRRIRWARHQIVNGESLSTIAAHYHTSVQAVKEFNNLRNDRLRAGTYLMVPVALSSLSDYSLSADMRKTMLKRAPTGAQRFTYIVRRGDSLWTIARRHRVTVAKLVRWNGISSRSILRPGQKLAIWKGAPAGTGSSSASNVQQAWYVVRRGDNLSVIAKHHRLSLKNLVAWNAISTDAILRPGQKLRVRPNDKPVLEAAPKPATPQRQERHIQYTVQRGDSLWIISQRFKVSVRALRRWNELPSGKYLQPGQQISVYIES